MPKEISDYLNKMGARIPKIKPGKATIEYLTKVQASTRFWGMSVLCLIKPILWELYTIYNLSEVLMLFNETIIHTSSSFSYNENIAGGLLLSTLATTSSILDHYLRSINLGFSISFTSVLIIVSTLLQALLFTSI